MEIPFQTHGEVHGLRYMGVNNVNSKGIAGLYTGIWADSHDYNPLADRGQLVSLGRIWTPFKHYNDEPQQEILPWWRHQMETFSALLAFVWGIHRWPVNSPHKGKWRGVLMFSLICAWINGWVNKREAGDLRRHRAHYDVTIMYQLLMSPASKV